MSTKTKRRVVTKSKWREANDAGPHYAVLPSGVDPDGEDHSYVRFRILSTGELLRSGDLPEALRDIALMYAEHPEGPEELMRELVVSAAFAEKGREALVRLIRTARDLQPHLVAASLVEPEVTAQEIDSGAFPELDVKMLVELASRRRNVDAAGNRLPIALLDDLVPFRRQPADGESPARGEDGGDAGGGDPAGGDDDAV